MQIDAAVLAGVGQPFTVDRVDLAEPRRDEVLVRIAGSGICHTDIGVQEGHLPTPLPVVLGHEGAGVVERVGADVRGLVPGDHVVLTVNTCGYCPVCNAGRPTYCHQLMPLNFGGVREDGTSPLSRGDTRLYNFFGQSSFATFAIANERNTVKVAKEAPLNMLGPFGCGFQTGAGTVINALRPLAGSTIAIFGGGAVGLSAMLAAKLSGCARIIVVDVRENRLALALELGATDIVDATRTDPAEWIVAATRGGVDFAVESTGVPAVFRQAVEAVHPLGTCALVGAASPGTELTLSAQSLFFGRTIRGVLEGDAVPSEFIPKLVDLFLAGRFPVDRLMSFYDLDQINAAVSDSYGRGTCIKPILRM